MILLQGHLQTVFDALYAMGIIDPVLKLDWSEELEKATAFESDINAIVNVVNSHQSDVDDLIEHLKTFDEQVLSFLAMEVAREYADFHSREELH